VLAAFDNPFLHIFGHPTGRLINKREPAPMRMEEILDKAARQRITIECNGCPDRMDLSAEHVRLALQRGLKVSVSSDAHSVTELASHLPFALASARKGWARVEDVVNTGDADEFLRRIRRG